MKIRINVGTFVLRPPLRWKAILPLTALLLLNSGMGAAAQDTQFTYQGRVTDHGTNFNGTGLFKFALVTSTNRSHQATATAAVTGGFVTSCTVTYGGTGYVTPPAVYFSGGGGSGAAATTVISGGVVTAITMTDAGAGYTSPPLVTIAPPSANIFYTTYWSNDGTGVNGSQPASAVSVPVNNNGLFTAALGDEALANMTPIPVAVFLQPGLQLQIWFNDGVSGFALMNPLQNLTAAPCAVMANCASNLLGTLPATSLAGTYSTAINLDNVGNSFTGSGSGLSSLNASQLTSGTVADNRLSGNVAKLNAAQTFTGVNTFSSGVKFGDGTVQTTAPMGVCVSSYGLNPATTNNFLAPTVVVTIINSSQRILVTSHKALGSTTGASGLNLYIGYRVHGSAAAPSVTGGGSLGQAVPANTRVLMGLSYIITGLAPGTYDVGLVGNSSAPAGWNSNEYGYTTALVF